MTYHIVYNPTAKNGKGKKLLAELLPKMDEAELSYELHETERAGHAEEIVRSLGVVDAVIAVGGDGTVHEVLNGLVDPTKTEFAILPAGTGNDFVANIGVDSDVDKFVARLKEGQPKLTNYMTFGDRRCMNVGGMGMDVEVLERCSRGILKGKIKYLMSLISCVFSYKGLKLTLKVNGEAYEKQALFVAVCNGSQFGGGIRICPTADVGDDKLEVVFVPKMGFFKLIKTFMKLMKGQIFSVPETEHYYCEEAEVVPEKPASMQLDGEIYYNNEVMKVALQKGLKMYR